MNGPSLEKVVLAWGAAPVLARIDCLEALAGQRRGKGVVPIVIRPKDAARMLSVTPRTLLNLKRRGLLREVKLPGNKRALGYLREEIEELARRSS